MNVHSNPAIAANTAAENAARITTERPGALRLGWAVVSVLWLRDLKRFFRQKSRIAGALVQPLIFWFVIGSGLTQSFRMPGAEHVGYLEYFYPGILTMVILFTSIFTTMSVIEDRSEGFLQAVLVAPAPRGALVLGKALGGTSVAALQAVLFLALAPWAGFPFARISWVVIVVAIVGTSLALSGVGFAMAWWLNSVQGYHALMSVLLVPLWVVSGAMFPVPQNGGWLSVLMRVNPMSYCVDAMRGALYGGGTAVPGGLAAPSAMVALGVVVALAAGSLALATWVCNRKG